MEMEFKDSGRRRRILLIVLGAALAIAAGWGAFMLASRGGPVAEVVKKSVLVAARDITARTAITPDDVIVRQVPVDEALSQTYDLPADVVGRLTSVPIYTDQQMTPNLFATTSADSDFSILGPDEQVSDTSPLWRAIAIEIPKDRAVGGEIKAGEHVDLVVSVEFKLLTLNPDGSFGECVSSSTSQFQCGKSTKITFQDVEVLKATPDEDMYVFKMDLHQAEQVSHVIQQAPDSFTMVLRPDEDTRDVDLSQYGTTTDRLIMTYFYPAPQWADLAQLLGPSPYPYPGAPQAPNPGASPIPGGVTTPTGSPQPSGSPTPGESPAASPEGSPAP